MSQDPRVVKAKHPLMTFVPTAYSLEEWMAKWKETKKLGDLLGLLHLLTTGEAQWWWKEAELVSLLLDIANGYDGGYDFHDRQEYDYNNEIARNRQKISEKAFGVLCAKFFNGGARDGGHPLWWWILEHDVLFQKVLWFLRPDRKNYFDSSFYSDANIRHQQEMLREFMREFTRLGWKFSSMSERCYNETTDESVRNRLVATRPQFIEILDQLKELNWLNTQELDEASLKKLVELAMGKSYSFPHERAFSSSNYRKPASLQEAVLGGSVAAQVVLLHRVRERERKRIKALYEKSCKEQKEADRQRALKVLETEQAKLAQMAIELEGQSGKR